jgi:hypothetical protein
MDVVVKRQDAKDHPPGDYAGYDQDYFEPACHSPNIALPAGSFQIFSEVVLLVEGAIEDLLQPSAQPKECKEHRQDGQGALDQNMQYLNSVVAPPASVGDTSEYWQFVVSNISDCFP